MKFTIKELVLLRNVLVNMSNAFGSAIAKHYEYLLNMSLSVNGDFGIEEYLASKQNLDIERLTGRIVSHRAKLLTMSQELMEINDVVSLLSFINKKNILNLDKNIINILEIHEKIAEIVSVRGICEIKYNAYSLMVDELVTVYEDCIYLLHECVDILEQEIHIRKTNQKPKNKDDDEEIK